jgi:hypothetical protein
MEPKEAKDFATAFYNKYKAYVASKRKVKKPETKIVKENIDLIKGKISKLKRLV